MLSRSSISAWLPEQLCSSTVGTRPASASARAAPAASGGWTPRGRSAASGKPARATTSATVGGVRRRALVRAAGHGDVARLQVVALDHAVAHGRQRLQRLGRAAQHARRSRDRRRRRGRRPRRPRPRRARGDAPRRRPRAPPRRRQSPRPAYDSRHARAARARGARRSARSARFARARARRADRALRRRQDRDAAARLARRPRARRARCAAASTCCSRRTTISCSRSTS